MGKFALVFPGQGSQKLGMLNGLAAEFPIVGETFREASAVLNQDLWEIAQHDSHHTLDQTQFTQPIRLTASIAIWRLWRQRGGPLPSIMAGHSLGEYSALVCAGVLGFADAVKLLHHRGQLMQSAVAPGQGKMAAIIGLESCRIEEICAQAAAGQIVSAANFNCPGQTVIAGDKDAVERAMLLCKEAGARRVLALSVSVPAHCALMQPAADKLAQELDRVAFQSGAIPVVQNVDAEICKEPEIIKQNLIKQLYSSVLWEDSIQLIYKSGIDKVVECGPGKILCGLIKRIEPELACFASDAPQSLDGAIADVSA